MSEIILLILFVGVLYFALTYLKGSRNTNTNSDGFITHPFNGKNEGNDSFPPETEGIEEELEMKEVSEDASDNVSGDDSADVGEDASVDEE